MRIVCNFICVVLALIAITALTSGALALSLRHNLADSKQLETRFATSKMYDSITSRVINDAIASNSADLQALPVSQATIRSAAQTALNVSVVHQSVNRIIEANYAWLEGKTVTPSFSIDLKPVEDTFLAIVGTHAKAHLDGLPSCSYIQLLALRSQTTVDPATITCLPPGLDTATAINQQIAQLDQGGALLHNPVLTARTLNPNKASQEQPYYANFENAPKIYQDSMRAPLYGALLALLCIVAIAVLTRNRRVVGWYLAGIMLLAGIITLIGAAVGIQLANLIKNTIAKNIADTDLSQPLTTLVRGVLHDIAQTDLLIGGILFVISIPIFATLLITRKRAVASHVNNPPVIAQ